MKAILLLAGSAVALQGCHFVMGQGIQGSGKSAMETRTVPTFTRIESEGSGDVIVEIGPVQSIEIELDDNLLKNITTEVKDGTLTISSKEGYNTKIGLKVKVTVQSLAGASISGSGSISAINISAKAFAASIAGSGEIHVSGNADTLSVGINGSGELDLAMLTTRSADITINGSGSTQVAASESLTATINGSGDVTFTGNPKVTKSVNGSGDVHKK